MEPTTMEPQPALSPTAIQVMAPGPVPPTPNRAAARKPQPLPMRILHLVSSLRVTVVLFLMSMVIVFFGTLAQKEMSNIDVVSKYFRSAYVLIPFRVLSFFTLDPKAAANSWVLPFPGGWTLGTLLLINLLTAHALRFKMSWKKSGVVILHFGILLMMLGEVITGHYAHEGMLVMSQGETVNYLQRSGELELAITDVTDPDRKEDDIVAVYDSALARGGKISDKELPFDLNVVKFLRNSELRRWKEGDPPPLADTGRGKDISAIEKPAVQGTNTEKQTDVSTIVVELKDKATGKSLGTRVSSMWLDPEKLEYQGKTYEISLRNRREYRPFFMRLNKAEEKKQPNMEMAKDYSSWVQLIVPQRKEDREVHIYMNTPLRYGGETFFQANMSQNPDTGVYTTGLQVVRNPGWILPYLSCILVALGMLIHFGIHLVGFVTRRVA
jgi:hypothetical protein